MSEQSHHPSEYGFPRSHDGECWCVSKYIILCALYLLSDVYWIARAIHVVFSVFLGFIFWFYFFLSLNHSFARRVPKTKDTYLDAEVGRNLSAHLVFVRFICLFRCYHLYCNIQYYVIICCNLSYDDILEGTICDLRMTETICINREWVWMSLSAPLYIYICTWYQFTSFFCFVEVCDHFVKRESYL